MVPTVGSRAGIDRAGQDLIKFPPPPEAVAAVRDYRMFRASALNECIDRVTKAELPTHSLLSARTKRLHSIRRKLYQHSAREYPIQLSRMYDLIGLRVVCDHFDEALRFSERLGQQGSRVNNYVESPQATGYRAIHHILKIRQSLSPDHPRPTTFAFEVQVRTYHQNQWAIWSESYGEEVKAGRAPGEIRERLLRLSRTIGQWEESHQAHRQDDLPPRPTSGEHNMARIRRQTSGEPDVTLFDLRHWGSAFAELFRWEIEDDHDADTLLLFGSADPDGLLKLLKVTHQSQFGRVRVPADIEANASLRFRFDE